MPLSSGKCLGLPQLTLGSQLNAVAMPLVTKSVSQLDLPMVQQMVTQMDLQMDLLWVVLLVLLLE